MPPFRRTERWLPVPGWPNYEVSNLGQVRSLPVYRKAGRAGWRWTKGKILKPTLWNWHVTVSLHNEAGEQWTAGLASLVLRAFVGPPTPGHEARHMYDPDPWNCQLWNLAWGTHAQNVADETRHYGKHHCKGLRRPPGLHARGREVRKLLQQGFSNKQIAAKLQMKAKYVSRIRRCMGLPPNP